MISVDVKTDRGARSRVVAPSIREALLMAGGEPAGARVCFPIDPEGFFVGAVPNTVATDPLAPSPAIACEAGAP